ncbi:MAG: DUF6715 family protein [Cellulosilyticaceae bacterium]
MRKVFAILLMILICTVYMLSIRKDVTKDEIVQEKMLDEQEIVIATIEERLENVKKTLNTEYPSTPKELMTTFNEVMQCQYNKEIEIDKLEDTVNLTRMMYSEELISLNEYERQYSTIVQEITENNKSGLFITGSRIVSIEFKLENMAYIIVVYETTKGELARGYDIIKENAQWKIHDWKDLMIDDK